VQNLRVARAGPIAKVSLLILILPGNKSISSIKSEDGISFEI